MPKGQHMDWRADTHSETPTPGTWNINFIKHEWLGGTELNVLTGTNLLTVRRKKRQR